MNPICIKKRMPKPSTKSTSQSKSIKTQSTNLAKSMASLSLKTGSSVGGKMMSSLFSKKK